MTTQKMTGIGHETFSETLVDENLGYQKSLTTGLYYPTHRLANGKWTYFRMGGRANKEKKFSSEAGVRKFLAKTNCA